MDQYVRSASNSSYHGMDLLLLVLSKMLKVTIGTIMPDYVWISCPDVNLCKVSVLIMFDGQKCFYGTGMSFVLTLKVVAITLPTKTRGLMLSVIHIIL